MNKVYNLWNLNNVVGAVKLLCIQFNKTNDYGWKLLSL